MLALFTLRGRVKRSAAEWPLVAPPVAGRLIGNAGVVGAIGQVARRLAAAEVELAAAGVADRPFAGFLGQLQQSFALLDRNIDQLRLQLGFVVVGERGIPAHGRTRNPHHAGRSRLARPRHAGRGAFGPPGQAQAVHLADDRVAGDAAELRGDLAR